MTKNICAEPSCRNYEKYCRIHLKDEDTPQESKEKVYAKVRKEYLKEHPKCEVSGCTKDAKDIHHKAGRTGKLLTDTNYFMAVCRGCHLWIESHPVKSRELGYSVSRHKKKA